MEKKFTALHIISVIFKIFAWIVAALTVIGFLGMLVGGTALSQLGGRYGAAHYFPFGAIGGVAILIAGAIWFLSLLAAAELIMLLLAIEQNTRTLKPRA